MRMKRSIVNFNTRIPYVVETKSQLILICYENITNKKTQKFIDKTREEKHEIRDKKHKPNSGRCGAITCSWRLSIFYPVCACMPFVRKR